MPPTNFLDEIREAYAHSATQRSYNLLLCGQSGTGKTRMVGKTAIPPVLFFSFDPGGTKNLKPEISAGRVVVDPTFEGDDSPDVYNKFVKRFDMMAKDNFFDRFGTVCVDSLSTLGVSMMNLILHRNIVAPLSEKNKAAVTAMAQRGIIQLSDYQAFWDMTRRLVARMTRLSSDVILTAHLQEDKDELTGGLRFLVAVPGQGKYQLPNMFDEIWTAQTRTVGSKTTYRVLTVNDGSYTNRSRLPEGKLDKFEAPDIQAIFTKAGREFSPKPLLKPATFVASSEEAVE